jgi:hypothetical protein
MKSVCRSCEMIIGQIPVVVLVYASATADSFAIEITVRTDQLLDTAKVLAELELV